MWNSLPGGLLVLPEYSTHLAHFPFYYLGLGKHAHVKLLMVLCGGAEVQAVAKTSAQTSSDENQCMVTMATDFFDEVTKV